MHEIPVTFMSDGQWLSGIIHRPTIEPIGMGVLIVVGGPQTRVGSHRQFLLLARRLVSEGYHVMRFDYHGMGDSEGKIDTFLNVTTDIDSAISQFKETCPDVKELALWGLCDAASAILLYCQRYSPKNVKQLILLNPWVTSEQLKAKALLKHYYIDKVLSKQFWKNLLHLNVDIKQSIIDLSSNIKAMVAVKPKEPTGQDQVVIANNDNYVELMQRGWRHFEGCTQIILSGNDLVAAQFEQLLIDSQQWSQLMIDQQVLKTTIEGANHTFASARWRKMVEDITIDALCAGVSNHKDKHNMDFKG